ncbi:hypothetical protein ACSBR1_040807 [Camellia fascicularis]
MYHSPLYICHHTHRHIASLCSAHRATTSSLLAPSSLTAKVAPLSPASPFSLTGSPSLEPLYEDEPKFILVFAPQSPLSLSVMIQESTLSKFKSEVQSSQFDVILTLH